MKTHSKQFGYKFSWLILAYFLLLFLCFFVLFQAFYADRGHIWSSENFAFSPSHLSVLGLILIIFLGGMFSSLLLYQYRGQELKYLRSLQQQDLKLQLESYISYPYFYWRSKQFDHKESSQYDAYVVSRHFQDLYLEGKTILLHLDPLLDLLTQEDKGIYQDFVEKLVHQKNGFSVRLQLNMHHHVRVEGDFLALQDSNQEEQDYVYIIKVLDETKTVQEVEKILYKSHRIEESNRLYLDVLKKIKFPIWYEDEKGKIIWCNHSYGELAGVNVSDVILEQVHLIPALFEQKKSPGADYLIYSINIEGQARKFYFYQQNVCLDEQKYHLAFGFEVTEFELSSASLRREVDGYEMLLKSLDIAIAFYGPDTRMDFYNHKYADVWQLNENWLMRKPFYTEVADDIRLRKKSPDHPNFQHFKNHRLELFKSLHHNHEDIFYLPDGRILHSTILPHPHGGLVFIQNDVTMNYELERKYKTLLAVQKETIDHMAEGICVIGSDGLVKLFNTAYCEIFNLDPVILHEKMHIKNLVPLIQESMTDASFRFEDDLRGQLMQFALERQEHKGVMELNKNKILSYSTIPLPDGANLNSFMDITQNVKAEHTLKNKNIILKQTNKLKSDFIKKASYNLRIPLNSIIGFTEVLKEQYFGKLNEKQVEYCDDIYKESLKLMNVIDNISDLSSIEANQIKLKRRRSDLLTLMKEIEELAENWKFKHQTKIKIDISMDNTEVYVDPLRFKQILMTLINNYSDHYNYSNEVKISLSKQEDQLLIRFENHQIQNQEEIRLDSEFLKGSQEAEKVNKLRKSDKISMSLVSKLVSLHKGKVMASKDNDVHNSVYEILLPSDSSSSKMRPKG